MSCRRTWPGTTVHLPDVNPTSFIGASNFGRCRAALPANSNGTHNGGSRTASVGPSSFAWDLSHVLSKHVASL